MWASQNHCVEAMPQQWVPRTVGLSACSFRWMWAPNKAEAALLQFPTTSLRNKYYLVRSAEPETCSACLPLSLKCSFTVSLL